MSWQLSSDLHKRYRGDKYVHRLPFMINRTVDDGEIFGDLQPRDVNQENDVFFGIPGFRALTILANYGVGYGKPFKKAVFYDQNQAQIKAMHAVLTFIAESNKDPAKFVKKYIPFHMEVGNHVPRLGKNRQTNEDRQFFAVYGRGLVDQTEDELKEYFAREMDSDYSWLLPKKFARIADMVTAGGVDTAILDLRDPERVSIAKAALTEQGLRAGVIYPSSLIGFHTTAFDYNGRPNKPENRRNFYDNLNLLADNRTNIVASIPKALLGEPVYGFALKEHSKREFQQYEALNITEKLYIFSYGRNSMVTMLRKGNSGQGNFILGVNGDYEPTRLHHEAFEAAIKQIGFRPLGINLQGDYVFEPSEGADFQEFAPKLAEKVIEFLIARGIGQEHPGLIKKER